MLSNFSKKRHLAIKAYRKFVTEGRNQPKPWEALRNQIYLGDDKFVEQSKQKIPQSASESKIPDVQSKPRSQAKPMKEYEILSKTRNDAIVMAFASGAYTMKEIGEYFEIHYSTVSRIIGAR